ncbi:MAG: Gfo/Idh/MocA family oxidoreductase [Acidobacteriota bacterium]|nr:Gfo/Idh/MocA family oxidoreductase [Acidobacteriota bacterium]
MDQRYLKTRLAAWTLLIFSGAVLPAADLRLGFVGTDTSHVTAFTKMLNDPAAPDHISGAKVVAAYKGGSPDIESSRSRIERFTQELRDKWQVRIFDSIPEMCKNVDAVLIESVDGRVHLAEARQVIAAHKPVFIDKPLASTLEDAREIARLAKDAGVPWFSASSLRFGGVMKLRSEDLDGAATWGPGPLEEHHHLDLSWYAIHPLEMLYTLMGQGCEQVTRITGGDADLIVGRWKGGRIGTIRALRPYGKYGAVAFRRGQGKGQTAESSADPSDGYAPLVREIVKFFETGTPPVPNAETLEMFAFMDAAQRSKEAGGNPMTLR